MIACMKFPIVVRSVMVLHDCRAVFADSRAADEYLAQSAHYHREQDGTAAELMAAGKSPVPPGEWAP
jgi:hypothetical protein